MKDLEDEIERLQKEIKELDYQQVCASNDNLTMSNVWDIALEYFRIFRHGFKESSYERSVLALRFLQKSMAPDVSDGHFREPKTLLRNWVVFSRYFDDIHVELKSMENTTKDTLLAATTTSITISSNTLRLLFPHLNSDGHGGMDGGTWSQLAQRLEGQRLVMKSSVRFEWDDANQRVVRILTWSDMLTAMLDVLGSLKDVSHAFDGALVAPDCRLIL